MPFPSRVPPVQVYEGDTLVFPTYTFAEGGVAIDLSSYTWAAQWRVTADATDSITLTLDLSQQVAGKITPSATALQTAQMTSENGVWDLQSTKAGVVRTWVYGPTVSTKDVTRLG